MKKLLIILCALLLATAPCVTYASESAENTESIKHEAPWEYGEMKDGLFVRTIVEEVSWYKTVEDFNINDYMAELAKANEARTIGYLTPEMETAGYILVRGMPIPPEEQSDANSADKATELANKMLEQIKNGEITYGYLSVSLLVESIVHEVCFIEVTNVENGALFNIQLYEQNGYTKNSYKLPPGTYVVTAGGVTNDFTSSYTVNELGTEFTVIDGAASIIQLTIGDVDLESLRNGITKETEEEIEMESETEPIKENDESQKNKNTIPIGEIIAYMFITAGIGGLIYFIYKKHKK